MDIFEYLFGMQKHIILRDWNKLESEYKKLCTELAGIEQTELISNVNVSRYEDNLFSNVYSAAQIAKKSNAKSIYFEYDMDNNWIGCSFVCKKYNPRVYEDDSWAAEWFKGVKGPSMPEFSNIFDMHGFDSSDTAVGSTLYLIARTVACFGRSVEKLQVQMELDNTAVCIGFHDQDVVFRVMERGDKNIKSLLKVLGKPPKRYPEMADTSKQLSVVIEPLYDSIGFFVENIAYAQRGDRFGYIDKLGNMVIPFVYEGAKSFSNGFAGIKINGKWGYINKVGEIVIEPKYEDVNVFNNGYAMVKIDGKYGSIDNTGRIVTECIYDDVSWMSGEELIGVKLNGKWGYCDEKGTLIIPARYSASRFMLNQPGKFCEGLAYVECEGKFGYIDKMGNSIITFTPVDERYGCRLTNFSEGVATVEYRCYDQQYIDKEGNVIAKGLVCSPFSEGMARVSVTHSKSAFINKSGQIIINEGKRKFFNGVNETDVRIQFGGSVFKEGVAHVSVTHDCWGYIDITGKLVMKFDYFIGSFSEGFATISGTDNKRNDKTGFINKEGQMVMKPYFDCAFDFKDGIAQVRLDGKYGYVGLPK